MDFVNKIYSRVKIKIFTLAQRTLAYSKWYGLLYSKCVTMTLFAPNYFFY